MIGFQSCLQQKWQSQTFYFLVVKFSFYLLLWLDREWKVGWKISSVILPSFITSADWYYPVWMMDNSSSSFKSSCKVISWYISLNIYIYIYIYISGQTKERKMFSDNVSSSLKIFNFWVMSKSSSKEKKIIYATCRGNSMPRG